jgi:hypothetical protein
MHAPLTAEISKGRPLHSNSASLINDTSPSFHQSKRKEFQHFGAWLFDKSVDSLR